MEDNITFNGEYALAYIRNGQLFKFPVKDLNHAIALAENIADSDLLNDRIDFNSFDLVKYDKVTTEITESWEDEETGEDFEEYWRNHR